MQSTTDLGVVVGGKNLSVTGLAVVRPPVGLGGADTVKTGESGDLAKPAADEDVLEVVRVAGGEDLAEGAGVELVYHLAVGRNNGVHGVGLELGVVGKGLQAHLRTPSVNDGLVAGRSGRRSRSFGLGAGRGLVDDHFAAGSRRSLVLGRCGRGNGRCHVGGLVVCRRGGLGLVCVDIHGVNGGLVDDVYIHNLLVLGVELGCRESSAGKGKDSNRSAHFDSVDVEVDSELT